MRRRQETARSAALPQPLRLRAMDLSSLPDRAQRIRWNDVVDQRRGVLLACEPAHLVYSAARQIRQLIDGMEGVQSRDQGNGTGDGLLDVDQGDEK
jgi:hypothetical protein